MGRRGKRAGGFDRPHCIDANSGVNDIIPSKSPCHTTSSSCWCRTSNCWICLAPPRCSRPPASRRTAAGPAYAVHVVSERGGPVRSSCGVEVLTRSWRDAPSGTLVVPGGEARAAAVTPAMRRYLHAHRQAGAWPASARAHSCWRPRACSTGGAPPPLASCRRACAQPSGRASRRRPDPRLRWRYVDLPHYRRHRPRAGDGRIRPGRGGGGRHGARDGGLPPPLGGQSQFSALQDLAPDKNASASCWSTSAGILARR